MEGESGFIGSIIDEFHTSDIQRDQMEGESGVTRSIMDELHSWHRQGDQRECESMISIKVSSMSFILGISNEIKW